MQAQAQAWSTAIASAPVGNVLGIQLMPRASSITATIEDGQTIRGRLIGWAQFASGRFAMIDDGLSFSLVPWRPVIEKEIGRDVVGVRRNGDVSWQFGRKLGLGI